MGSESTPRTSAKWVPRETFAHEMGMADEQKGIVGAEEQKTALAVQSDAV
jgi:hypothetical protein